MLKEGLIQLVCTNTRKYEGNFVLARRELEEIVRKAYGSEFRMPFSDTIILKNVDSYVA